VEQTAGDGNRRFARRFARRLSCWMDIPFS
jgi:hypothetical protein